MPVARNAAVRRPPPVPKRAAREATDTGVQAAGRQLRRVTPLREPAFTISNDSTRKIVLGSALNHPAIGVEPAPQVPAASCRPGTKPPTAKRRGGAVAVALTMLIFMGYVVLAALEAARDLFARAGDLAMAAGSHVGRHWQRAAKDAGWR